MPTPVKPMLHPEKLSARFTQARLPLQNGSFGEFRQRLEQEGIGVFDVTETLHAAKQETGEAQFLQTDTQWTPGAMERSARALAEFLRSQTKLPDRTPVAYQRRPMEVRQLGDIATMLKLPPGQRLYPLQRVQVQQVRLPTGGLWRPDPNAEILLLGDSFSNIYSLSGLGWGEGAGFAEQLSFALRRPLDCILVNAGGSYSTRQRLCQQLARGNDRLAGKRLVIWQFAMRDLLLGDWKILDLPP
jgi:alginate O-acetyltransferase complex protein AlgJ